MITRHVYRVYIRATAEQVWQALLDPEFTRRYFHDTAFDETPQAGQPYRTTMSNGAAAVDGIIEVCEPPRRLVQTWHVLYDAAMAEEPASRVEWTITDAGDGLVRLDLEHGDLARSPLTWAHVKDGWVWIIQSLKSMLETGEPLPPESVNEPAISQDPAGDWHRAQGIECHNGVWEMVAADRTPANDEEMLRRAYASAYHWQRAARRAPVNEVRALYMLSKAHLLAGNEAMALHYGDLCMAGTVEAGLVDFDLAYAHEARARALAALGRLDEALDEWAAAKAVPIADPEDLAIVEADFADAPATS
jgi:uncharacterized protein YndB with AHSA1/START domain